jgi:hypothetical protein
MKHIAFYFYALYCATLPGPLDEADGSERDGRNYE